MKRSVPIAMSLTKKSFRMDIFRGTFIARRVYRHYRKEYGFHDVREPVSCLMEGWGLSYESKGQVASFHINKGQYTN